MSCRGVIAVPLAAVVMLAGCGGSGNSSPPPETTQLSTLAYVVTECREDKRHLSLHQALKIRRSSGEVVTVLEFPALGPLPALGLCSLYGQSRAGDASVVAGVFQRLGVSPDGSTVVFEVTGDLSILAGLTNPLLPPEQEGIFSVRADGTGLRRLRPASREASFLFARNPDSVLGALYDQDAHFGFSPDGGTVTFTDLGPGPDGEESVQIFTMDLASGSRWQITQLPQLQSLSPTQLAVKSPFFLNTKTVAFTTLTQPDGLNYHTVRADGTGGLTTQPPPSLTATGGQLFLNFFITPAARTASNFPLPGTPANNVPIKGQSISEVFVISGADFFSPKGASAGDILQLTSFGRADTGNFLTTLSADGQRVLFDASVNWGEGNPHETCQIFSVNTLGGDLRLLTHFDRGEQSELGCVNFGGTSCVTRLAGQDLSTDTVIFFSDCDPFGTDPASTDAFAMRSDGSDLHQLTQTKGMSTEADGTVDVELPGPYAYPEAFR